VKKPFKFLAIAIAILVIAAGLLAATPVARAILYFLVWEPLHPELIGWDSKSAWRRCDSAISGETAWPRKPPDACAAMRMCANEANLDEKRYKELVALTRRLDGCGEP
jgi:hypothetical protein